jgi:hypothetical protein
LHIHSGVECVGSDRDADLMSRLPHSIVNLRVTMVRVAHEMNIARKVGLRFLMNRGADAFFIDPRTPRAQTFGPRFLLTDIEIGHCWTAPTRLNRVKHWT